MIKTQEEYENACNYIDADMELYDFRLSDKMSSYEYNLYLQDTEYFLNFLYEKIRLLEELCDYMDQYTDTIINSARMKIDASIALLNRTLQARSSAGTTVISPQWDSHLSNNFYDRDGTKIPVAFYEDGYIEPYYTTNNYVEPQILTEEICNQAYSNYMDTEDGTYYVASQSTSPRDGKETVLNILLPENASCNFIDAMPINCRMNFERNERGFSVRMQSSGYDKELRPFDYTAYSRPARHHRPQKPVSYDAAKSLEENRCRKDNLRRDTEHKQYMRDVRNYQKTANSNQEKSRAWGDNT